MTRIRGRVAFIPDSYHGVGGFPPTGYEATAVARVLICEPHDDIAALLELVVRRLGHDPVICLTGDVEHIGVDAAVIEPGEPVGLRIASSLRAKGVPRLFTRIFPAETEALELNPSAYLVKPFPLFALERAVQSALEPVESVASAAAV